MLTAGLGRRSPGSRAVARALMRVFEMGSVHEDLRVQTEGRLLSGSLRLDRNNCLAGSATFRHQ